MSDAGDILNSAIEAYRVGDITKAAVIRVANHLIATGRIDPGLAAMMLYLEVL